MAGTWRFIVGFPSELRLRERVVEVPQDVVEGFEADGEPDHLGQNARCALLVLVELPVRRRCRMDDQRFGVADVGEVRKELHRFDAAYACRGAPLDAECEY